MHVSRTMPIKEGGEPLEKIPRDGRFAFLEPHPYMSVGAPYGGASPWMLRRGVLEALERAAALLATRRPGWKILVFDAYRPLAVQYFMVDHEFRQHAKAAGLDPATLTEDQKRELYEKVFRIWAPPSDDPASPPPHSTGAAIDCTLVDEAGREVFMGSPIDENSDRSLPDHFAHAVDEAGKLAHQNRLLLQKVMEEAGFTRLRHEWWHFSMGDQYAAWRRRESGAEPNAIARYGRADLV